MVPRPLNSAESDNNLLLYVSAKWFRESLFVRVVHRQKAQVWVCQHCGEVTNAILQI